MAALARVGWTISAAFFALVAASVLHVDHVGAAPALILLFIVAVCSWRPLSGLEILAAAIPVSSFLMSERWNGTVSWAEVYACGAIAGLSIDAARQRRGRMPYGIGAPAFLFGLVLLVAIAASVSVKALTLGPEFERDLARHLTELYFVEQAAYPGLHAGMLLLEGILLFTVAARLARQRPDAATRIIAAVTIGATLAGVMNMARLLQGALRGTSLLSELARLSRTFRWNVEFTDYNAACSYFVMALFLAAGLIATARAQRRAWTACAFVIAAALWLTGSRAAYVSGVLAIAAGSALQWVKPGGRRRFAAAAALATAVLAAIAVIAFAAPERGNQHSSRVAADIRLQMAIAGGRMIAANPVFGIGLGEFYQQSGNFISPELLTMFPVSTHENAHNNFVQVAAELGLTGGITFTWLVAAGLFVIARHAARTRAPGTTVMFMGLAAFVITWLAGHPLLIPEPGYVFWTLFGAGVGTAMADVATETPRSLRWFVALAAIAIIVSAPLHVRAVMDDAQLEHVGFGWSPWIFSQEGIRYRSATGHGTVFVPARSAFTFSINPRSRGPVRLELRLEGRVADVITLAPDKWTDVTLPVHSDRALTRSRFVPMELRVLEGDQIEIWLTKVRPIIH